MWRPAAPALALLVISNSTVWAQGRCPNLTHKQAEFAARISASTHVRTTTKGAFTVQSREWKVRCTTKDPANRTKSWTCRVTHGGPCSGNVIVHRSSSCGVFTEEKVGCIAH